ncbi:MAG: hypothetical protein WB341_09920 [Terracidiphilus sp.]
MRKLQLRMFFAIIATIGIMASVQDGLAQAVTSDNVPSQILALVPPGAQLTVQHFMKVQGEVTVSFVAERKSGLRSQTMTRFLFNLASYDNNSYLWKMIAPSIRGQLDSDIKQKTQSWVGSQDGMISPAEVTQYPWGKGVTQRRRFYGEGAPDFYSYHCLYWGVVGTNVFTLEVEEIPDRADADKWARNVADTAANISPSTLSK